MYKLRVQLISVFRRAYAMKPLSIVSEGTVGKFEWEILNE
jgi:hypothetical protein